VERPEEFVVKAHGRERPIAATNKVRTDKPKNGI
jgi:hypothetical protein